MLPKDFSFYIKKYLFYYRPKKSFFLRQILYDKCSAIKCPVQGWLRQRLCKVFPGIKRGFEAFTASSCLHRARYEIPGNLIFIVLLNMYILSILKEKNSIKKNLFCL